MLSNFEALTFVSRIRQKQIQWEKVGIPDRSESLRKIPVKILVFTILKTGIFLLFEKKTAHFARTTALSDISR